MSDHRNAGLVKGWDGMREFFKKDLIESKYVHRPLRIHEEEMREHRCQSKRVLSSTLLDDLTTLDHWEAVGPYAHMELSREHVKTCVNSLKFTSPTRIEQWERTRGRIYTIPKVIRRVDHENWEHINRISFWVYADMPGYRSICLRMQFLNGGAHRVPDKYDREGHHNINLTHAKWQHVSVEIPDVHREDIIGLSFEYDMVGEEITSTKTACWYITDIMLETLAVEDLDNIEGWQVGQHRIAFSGSGYQPGSRKTAIVNEPGAVTFKLVETMTGRTVLEKPVERVATSTGEYQVLDFTEVHENGEYLIVCGSAVSRSFPIRDDAWEDSIWKMLNYLFCQRCGFEVPGKHLACHRDVVCYHDGRGIVVNGGWHDAGDMTQNLITTAECDYMLFELLTQVEGNEPLYERVLEEAKWGLDYVLKTRFGDGYRCISTSKSCWTDGVMGNSDDINCEAGLKAIENFAAASLEALAYRTLRGEDPVLADYCLQCAKEDWAFAYAQKDNEGYDSYGDPNRISSQVLTYSLAVRSAVDLYRACGEETYKEQATALIRVVMDCQQVQTTDWDVPFAGFFYDNTRKRLIQHFSHRSHEAEPIYALTHLTQTFPNHEDWTKWYYALSLYGDYNKRVHEYTAPYYMAPASIYQEDEFLDETNDFGALSHVNHNDEMHKEYADQVRTGFPLGKGFYLRRMPVAFAYRGNGAITLANGKANALLGKAKNDFDHAELAQRQLEWIVGKNPFAQSVIFGEGYDYCSQYTVLPGEMVGEMSVGIENYESNDAPYWPQINTCVYKEVWTHVVLRWGWLLADTYGNAQVKGVLNPSAGDITFTGKLTKAVYCFTPCKDTSLFRGELPAGEYVVEYDGLTKSITAVTGKSYTLSPDMAALALESTTHGNAVYITIKTSGRGKATLAVKAQNMRLDYAGGEIVLGDTLTIEGEILDRNFPHMAVFIPNGNLDEKVEVFGL